MNPPRRMRVDNALTQPQDESNPWGLSASMCRCVRGIVMFYDIKSVSRSLGVSQHTVADYLKQAYSRMGVDNRVQAAVAFDRWDREFA